MNTLHLTEDQLDDYLMGDLAAEPAVHLSVCEHCMARVAEAEAPMASFREMSLAWSERKSATMPVPVPVARKFGRVHWLTAGAGLVTAAIVLAVALPADSHKASLPGQQAAASPKPAAVAPAPVQAVAQPATLAVLGHTGIKSVTPIAASPDQIDRDNQMLQAISLELDAPRNADSYGLVAAARSGQ